MSTPLISPTPHPPSGPTRKSPPRLTRGDLSNVSGLGRGNAHREMPPLFGGSCEHVASGDSGESTRK